MSALLSLGMFAFSISTLAHNELQRRTEWRFAKNARYGAADAVQFLGPGEDTISLSGTVYSDISDGETSIDQLREMADQGEPWPLVSAAGRHFGSYVIERVDERHTAFWPDGSPRAIDFVIDLSRFPDQDQASGS